MEPAVSEQRVLLRHFFNPKVVQLGHTLLFRALKSKEKWHPNLSQINLFIVEYVCTAFQVKLYSTAEIFFLVLLNCERISTNQPTHLSLSLFFLFSFIMIQIASLNHLSQTILHISTEITKKKNKIHQVDRTTHAHCSTTVFSTGRVKRASTHLMQNLSASLAK